MYTSHSKFIIFIHFFFTQNCQTKRELDLKLKIWLQQNFLPSSCFSSWFDNPNNNIFLTAWFYQSFGIMLFSATISPLCMKKEKEKQALNLLLDQIRILQADIKYFFGILKMKNFICLERHFQGGQPQDTVNLLNAVKLYVQNFKVCPCNSTWFLHLAIKCSKQRLLLIRVTWSYHSLLLFAWSLSSFQGRDIDSEIIPKPGVMIIL